MVVLFDGYRNPTSQRYMNLRILANPSEEVRLLMDICSQSQMINKILSTPVIHDQIKHLIVDRTVGLEQIHS